MVRKCPPGVLCFENITLVIIAIIVIGIAIYAHSRFFGHGHGHGHDDGHHGGVPHESPAVVTVPLMMLAIPSVLIGLYTVGPMLFGDFFKGVIHVDPKHGAMAELAGHFHGWVAMGVHALLTPVFWLAAAGVATAYYFYMVNPALPAAISRTFSGVQTVLDNKYYFDKFNEVVFAGGARALGTGLWKVGDQTLIDGLAVNGSARLVGWFAGVLRFLQSGFIYHYAIAMIAGVAALILYFVPLTR